jgi:Mlc titration factor MtfA (ptsG expression regulator)
MAYYQNLLLFFGLLWALIMFVWLYSEYKRKKLLEKIATMPFPENYRIFLTRLSHYEKLTSEEKRDIHRSILRFMYTKTFVGAKNLEITDEMKVLIAFHACLLLLHIETENCYNNLKTIIVYDHPVMIDKVQNNGGIFSKEQFLISGQSANDTVIIIWNEARHEIYHPRHDNVILHEFAHEIDFMDGEIDGIPPMERARYHEWTSVFYKEFNRLSDIVRKNRDWGKYKLIGEYAATNEAEFFAVMTERFYESPQSLKKHFPDLYDELKAFYHIDPAGKYSKEEDV